MTGPWPAGSEAGVPTGRRQASSDQVMAILAQREADTAEAVTQRCEASMDEVERAAAAAGLEVLVLRSGDGYDPDRAGFVCWAEAVVYLAVEYKSDDDWHPAVPGCYKITLRSEEGKRLDAFGWHWDGQRHLRYETRCYTEDGAVGMAIADVFNAHAEQSDQRADRLSYFTRPADQRLAEAIRDLIRETR